MIAGGYVRGMSSQPPTGSNRTLPLPARAAVSLENDERLDPAVDSLSRVVAPLADSASGAALRGEWMGHALHPALTDLPLGMWTAASALDIVGGKDARPAAQRLLGLGLLAAAPTALTGWAEWSRAERPAQRVGVAHAALNVTAIALYAGSWAARRSERHRLGAALGMAGAGVVTAAAYLGGHLTTVRDVSSRHPAFGAPGSGSSRDASTEAAAPVTTRTATGADVMTAIAAQHARITMMVEQVTSSSPASQGEALRELQRYLAGHEAVEEELIHPLVPRVGDHEQGLARAREETGLAELMTRMGRLEPGTSSFDTQFGLFEEALKHHATAEEHEELPHLVRTLTDADAALIVEALAAHEAGASGRGGTFDHMLDAARAEVRELVAAHQRSRR